MRGWEAVVIGGAVIAWMFILREPAKELWKRFRSRRTPKV